MTTFAYQWFRGAARVAITGATAQTYTPVTADVGYVLSCGVIASNAAGSSAIAYSPYTGVIAAAAVGPTKVSITGVPSSAQVGVAYSFTPGTANGSGTRVFALTGTLPAGLTFSISTGTIAGTPTASGTFAGLSISVTDDTGTSTLSGLSLSVSAAAATVPDAPTLSAAPGVGQNVLTFSDNATGGAAITSHKLYRSTTSGAETLLGTISTGSPYTDTGLTAGTAYFYKLSAVNSVGESPLSIERSATPTAPAPTYTPAAKFNDPRNSGLTAVLLRNL